MQNGDKKMSFFRDLPSLCRHTFNGSISCPKIKKHDGKMHETKSWMINFVK